MGTEAERKKFVGQVRQACRIAERLRRLGVRPYGVVRIDSAASPDAWYSDPEANQKTIARTFREAADVAEGYGSGWPPRGKSAGEACTRGGRWSSSWS